jgi:hypothetical protein
MSLPLYMIYDYDFKGIVMCVLSFPQGENTKMSASDANSAIYVTDSAKEIKTKVCPVLKIVFMWNFFYLTTRFSCPS